MAAEQTAVDCMHMQKSLPYTFTFPARGVSLLLEQGKRSCGCTRLLSTAQHLLLICFLGTTDAASNKYYFKFLNNILLCCN